MNKIYVIDNKENVEVHKHDADYFNEFKTAVEISVYEHNLKNPDNIKTVSLTNPNE